MRNVAWLAVLLCAACSGTPVEPKPDAGEQPTVDAGTDAGSEPDAGMQPDAGRPPPPRLEWKKVGEAPPSRSNHVAFYWPPQKSVLVFSGNHVTGPIHDAWSWDGRAWQPRALAADEYPERKNAGLAVDLPGGRVFVFGGTWSGYPPGSSQHVVRVLGDTQRWDGTAWTELHPATSPSARGGAAMTYDAERGEVVLFGGSNNVDSFDDTWTFDGTTWTQRAMGAPHPSARINSRMAYDPERKRVVLFSGQASAPTGEAVNLADTWEWDGTAWRDVTALSAQPEGRGHHALAWDPLRRKVMLFGGGRHFAPLPLGSSLADPWEWDDATWARVTGATPPARTAPSLTFDAERNVMLLYGGFDDQLDLADLWEWNGQAWVERTTQPVPRSDFAFAQTRPGGDGLLFGGYVAGGGFYLSDTWRFTQGAWARVTGVAPPARSTSSLAFHGGDALLLGGSGKQGTSTVLRGDMWTLKQGESDWQKFTGALPPARRGGALAFDRERNVTVLFGGRGASDVLGDTWTWNGTEWSQLQPATSPPARTGAKLLFDPVRKQLVLVGGVLQDRSLPNDTWAFDGATWSLLDGLSAAPTGRLYNAAAFDSYGRLLAWGGTSGTTVLADLGVRDGRDWADVPAGPSPRLDAALIDLGDRWRTVFGSESDFSTWWEDRSDVWELGPAP